MTANGDSLSGRISPAAFWQTFLWLWTEGQTAGDCAAWLSHLLGRLALSLALNLALALGAA